MRHSPASSAPARHAVATAQRVPPTNPSTAHQPPPAPPGGMTSMAITRPGGCAQHDLRGVTVCTYPLPEAADECGPVTNTTTCQDRCATAQAGLVCRQAVSSMLLRTARPGQVARNVARAGW